MNKEDILNKINHVFHDILGHKNFSLSNNTSANDVEGWDSITHIMIISEIEKEFDIKFKLMDLMNMDNVGDLINIITKETK